MKKKVRGEGREEAKRERKGKREKWKAGRKREEKQGNEERKEEKALTQVWNISIAKGSPSC